MHGLKRIAQCFFLGLMQLALVLPTIQAPKVRRFDHTSCRRGRIWLGNVEPSDPSPDDDWDSALLRLERRHWY